MRARLRNAIRGCDGVRRLAPATAVGVGGRRSCRCGGACQRGSRPYWAAPRRPTDARNSASSRLAHTGGGVCAPVVAFAPKPMRTGCLLTADAPVVPCPCTRRGPAPCRCAGDGAARWHRAGQGGPQRLRLGTLPGPSGHGRPVAFSPGGALNLGRVAGWHSARTASCSPPLAVTARSDCGIRVPAKPPARPSRSALPSRHAGRPPPWWRAADRQCAPWQAPA
jgi:hypothetical protein